MTRKVRYVGDYYKVVFVKGDVYDLIEVTEDGLYKVYSGSVDDWALCSPDDFEIVGAPRTRGDDPIYEVADDTLGTCSPHTRG